MRINPSAIVFDLDDTLYLERDYVRSGFRAVGDWFRTEFGKPDFAKRANTAFIEDKHRKIFNVVVASYGLDPTPMLVDRLVEVYRNHNPSIALCDDARVCLKELGGSRPLALITDGATSRQWKKIRALGIETLFEAIIVTGELGCGHSKPDPLAFQLLEERLRLRGGQLVYVGDNPSKDFIAPSRLGWGTIHVCRKDGTYADRAGGHIADHRLDDLRTLRSMLQLDAVG